ncbi:hypothetical protein ACU4GI_12345 [Cupriavidus basilensis]
MASTVEAMGHTVVTTIDGPAAIVRAVKTRPDNPAGPRHAGYGRLRDRPAPASHPGLQHVSLVALTGYSELADRERTTQAGFDHHLVKPVDLDALSRILDELGEAA